MPNTKSTINTDYVGQDFDSFLQEQGLAADVEALAIKKVVVALLEKAGMTQAQLAERLHTSRTQVRRLLDPDNISITLATLQRAANITGQRLVIGFEPSNKRSKASRAKTLSLARVLSQLSCHEYSTYTHQNGLQICTQTRLCSGEYRSKVDLAPA